MLEELRAVPRRVRLRLSRFLGTDIPPRDLDLRFDLMVPRRGSARPALTQAALDEVLGPLRQNAHAYFPALLQQARLLNRYPLPAQRRMDVTVLLLRRFYADAMYSLQPMRRETRGLPETEATRTLLEAIADIAGALVVSYQMIFQGDYGASRFAYARLRVRAYLCAFRILELTRLEQRVRALRYQPLPDRAWLVANTVFRAMWGCENVEFPLRLLDADLREGKPADTCSLRDLYLSLQTFWLFDPFAWPNDQQSFVDTYVGLIDGGVTLAEDPGGPLGREQLIAYCHQAEPPARTRREGDLGPALVTDYRILALSVRQDAADLVKDPQRRNRFLGPRQLSSLKPVYQVAIARLMVRSLGHPGEWDDQNAAGRQALDLRIYTGFGEVCAHLQAVFSSDERVMAARRLSDIFAERSAVFGEDHTAAERSRWYVVFADERRMRISTQETRFTNAMVIGSLLAFGFGEAESRRPRLARVTRIQRPDVGSVLIDIDQVAEIGRPVSVAKVLLPTAAAEMQGQSPQPEWVKGILAYRPGPGWSLLLPQHQGYWEATPIDLRTDRSELRCRLGRLAEATPEFLSFDLPDLPPHLVAPAYPVPAPTPPD